jgi:hypothetical protein
MITPQLIDSNFPVLRLRPLFARLCRTAPAGSIHSFPLAHPRACPSIRRVDSLATRKLTLPGHPSMSLTSQLLHSQHGVFTILKQHGKEKLEVGRLKEEGATHYQLRPPLAPSRG